MIDKERLDNLLHACIAKDERLDDFAETINDSALLFGALWESTSRRFSLAREQYERCYYACTPEERTLFHQIESEVGTRAFRLARANHAGALPYNWMKGKWRIEP